MPKKNERWGFEVAGIKFEVEACVVVGSDPVSFYPRLRTDPKFSQMEPLGHAIDGCWNRQTYLSLLADRIGVGCEGDVGFFFCSTEPDLDCDPVSCRFDLDETERGVVAYFYELNLEVSERFFLQVAVEHAQICLDQGLCRRRGYPDDLVRVREAFAEELKSSIDRQKS